MTRLHVITGATNNYRPITDVTWPRLHAWCKRHDYALTIHHFQLGHRHPSWSKILAMTVGVPSSQPKLWVDADVLVLDLERDLDEVISTIEAGKMVFSSDNNGLCAGVFGIKGEWAGKFLKTVWDLGPMNREPSKHEQDTIKLLNQNFTGVQMDTVTFGPQFVSSPDHTWIKGAWAYHAWAGDWERPSSNVDKLERLITDWSPESMEAIRARR